MRNTMYGHTLGQIDPVTAGIVAAGKAIGELVLGFAKLDNIRRAQKAEKRRQYTMAIETLEDMLEVSNALALHSRDIANNLVSDITKGNINLDFYGTATGDVRQFSSAMINAKNQWLAIARNGVGGFKHKKGRRQKIDIFEKSVEWNLSNTKVATDFVGKVFDIFARGRIPVINSSYATGASGQKPEAPQIEEESDEGETEEKPSTVQTVQTAMTPFSSSLTRTMGYLPPYIEQYKQEAEKKSKGKKKKKPTPFQQFIEDNTVEKEDFVFPLVTERMPTEKPQTGEQRVPMNVTTGGQTVNLDTPVVFTDTLYTTMPTKPETPKTLYYYDPTAQKYEEMKTTKKLDWWWIPIGIGGAGFLGLLIWLIVRRKR